MLWENTKLPLRTWSNYYISLSAVEFSLGCDYLYMHGSACCHRLPLLLFFLVALYHLVDVPFHIEKVLANVVVLAFENLREATYRLLHGNILAFETGEYRCDCNWR